MPFIDFVNKHLQTSEEARQYKDKLLLVAEGVDKLLEGVNGIGDLDERQAVLFAAVEYLLVSADVPTVLVFSFVYFFAKALEKLKVDDRIGHLMMLSAQLKAMEGES